MPAWLRAHGSPTAGLALERPCWWVLSWGGPPPLREDERVCHETCGLWPAGSSGVCVSSRWCLEGVLARSGYWLKLRWEFPHPIKQNAPGREQEPRFRSPGTASPSAVLSAPTNVGYAHGCCQGPSPKEQAWTLSEAGSTALGKAIAWWNEWDEREKATSIPPIPHQGAGSFLVLIKEDIMDYPCLEWGGTRRPRRPGGISVQLCVLGVLPTAPVFKKEPPEPLGH